MEKKDSFKEALIGKRVMQGGVYNYLGEVKTVNAPIKWKSSAEHPIAFLSYITKEEMDILIKKNIYGSLKGKPNKGPFGLPSLQGSGSGSDSAGGGAPGGPGGSEGFSSDTGPGPGEAAGMGDTGSQAGEASYSDYSDAMMSPVGPEAMGLTSNLTATTKETEEQKTEQLNTNQQMARLSPIGIAAYNMSLANPTRSNSEKAISFALSPVGSTLATIADTSMRGVTAPNDYSQLTASVQTEAPTSIQSGGGATENATYVAKNSFINNLPDRKAYDMNLLNTAKSSFNYFDPYNYAKSNPLYKTFSKGGIINILLN